MHDISHARVDTAVGVSRTTRTRSTTGGEHTHSPSTGLAPLPTADQGHTHDQALLGILGPLDPEKHDYRNDGGAVSTGVGVIFVGQLSLLLLHYCSLASFGRGRDRT